MLNLTGLFRNSMCDWLRGKPRGIGINGKREGGAFMPKSLGGVPEASLNLEIK
ncbi:MAG: hypothetical protein KF846_08605 [Cyclobacteriaceae bacterium]|nr:hypothetical protein [Cyclobacteriaceae bacterium]